MSTLQLEERGAAAFVTLRRPPVNVLDTHTLAELEAALAGLARRREVKVLVLRSGLDGVFSAGMDVAEHAPGPAGLMLARAHALFRRLLGLPQASIAVVEGRCLGGGFELALCCDFVFAGERASFGLPEIDVGCFPPLAAALLPRLGRRAAAELVLLGQPIAAREAERLGLVTRVVDDPGAAATACAERLAGKSAAVLALARRALLRGAEGSLEQGLAQTEALYRNELLATADAAEGVRAFLEKRPPRWRDA